MAFQHLQLHSISPTNAIKKVMACRNRRSCYISLKGAGKTVNTSQNRQSLNISPTKAAGKKIAHEYHEIHDTPFREYAKQVLAGKNSHSRDTSLTNKIKEGNSFQSCDISPAKTVNKSIADKNSQSRDTSLTKKLKKGNSIQSSDISKVKTIKKRISSQNSQSRVTKTLEEENAIQSCIISLMETIEKEKFRSFHNNLRVEKIKKCMTF